ncbi:hemagglutinin repeat-containing protein [Achromobacter sp.]|uniref:hemagglutinin repeat-containing protein n=1 Tax=Achromobacter sp. TaxID=134375 RepID=UPI003C796EB5
MKTAGRDIALTSTAGSENHGSTWGTHLTGVARVEAGTLDMQAGRDLTLIAGQDVNARAADVTAGKQLAVAAGRDINLTAGVETGSARDEVHFKTKGFLSSKTTHTIKSGEWAQAQGSTFTGDTAVLMAGRDLNVIGSNVGAQKNLVMNAERDVNILPGVNTSDSYDYKKVTKSGLGATGGLSYGKRQQTDSLDGKKVFHTASTVGSVEGDVLINAGKTLNIVGSNVIAPKGDVTLIGQQVNIAAAQDTAREREFHEVKQSGLSINAKSPLLDAMQTANRMGKAADKTDNKIMKALALATTGVAAVNTYDEVMADPQSAGGMTLSIDYGSSKSQTTTTRNTTSSVGSNIAAGNDLTVIAKGAGADSDLTVTGSRLSAGNNALLKADGDILLQAARDTYEQHTQSKSTGASVGVGVTAGSNGVGFVATAGANASRGRSDGKDTTWTNSELTAGNVLALQSGGDTSLIGATARADQIIADVGRDLRIESLQDLSTYDSKKQGGGVQGSLCYGYCKSSVSGNVSQTRMKSDYKSVEEQSGLMAGDGGFVVDVKRNTTLTGGVISSSDQAVADGLNLLKTGTLVAEDVKNVARYKADRVSVSGGSGGGGTPVALGAFGESDSKTLSGISGGTVEIRDIAGQQALTGKTAAETIALLNRDTSDTLNSLNPIFDKEKIEAGFDIVEEMGNQAGRFFENRAAKAKALEEALKDEPEGPRRDELKAQYEDAKRWEIGSKSRLLATAILGALGGNVTGGASEMVQAAAVNYLQGLTAQQIKLYADALGEGVEAQAARAALHAVAGCAAGSVRGDGCGASALGAGAASVVNTLLDAANGKSGSTLSPQEKEARNNLVSSLLAGLAAGLGLDASAVVNSGKLETENNTLKNHANVHTAKFESKVKELAECVGDRGCQTAVGHFEGWIKVIDEQDLPACGSNDSCVQDKLRERGAYVAGLATATNRLSDPLIAGMDLLDAANHNNTYDRLELKDALVRFQVGSPDYANGVDRFVVETMMASPVVFAAVKGLSPLDSDGGVGGKPKAGNSASGSGDNPKSMLGAGGVQTASKTIWKGAGKERLDVENPNPGQRPGQIHYQDNEGNKYLYDSSTNSFPDAPKSVNKLLLDKKFMQAIEKGLKKYLGE